MITTGIYRKSLYLAMIMMTLAGSAELAGRSREEYITRHPVENGFALARDGDPAPLWVSDQDFPGVLRVAGHLQADMEKVTGNRPLLINDSDPAPCDRMIIAGTLGKNPLIDQLVQSRRISGKWLKGKRETYIATIIKEPAIGIREALVIAGSDKLGTIYGLYDLSRQIGVSHYISGPMCRYPRLKTCMQCRANILRENRQSGTVAFSSMTRRLPSRAGCTNVMERSTAVFTNTYLNTSSG